MQIDVATGGIDKATQAMAELARQTRETGAAARSIRMPAGSGAPGGAMSIRRAGAIQAAATSAQAMQVRAQGQLITAQIRAQAAAQRAQQQLDRATQAPATPQQRIMQAVLSSRFSAQGIQPLVGRTLAAAGISGPQAMPILGAIAGIALAVRSLEAFTRFVGEAAGRVNQFGNAVVVSGGTGAQVAGLRGMGLSAGEIAGAAGGLRERLASSPMAQAVGAQLGIGPVLPQSVGSQNNAIILQRALEGLRKITNAEEQLRKARLLGLDSMLDQIRVSDEVWNRGKRLADLNRQVYDDRTIQAARDLAGESRNFQLAVENFQGSIAKTAFPPAANLMGGLSTITEAAARGANSGIGQGFIKTIMKEVLGGIPGPLGPILAAAMELPGPGGKNDPGLTSQDRNTDALDRLAAELMRLNQNIGGGPRANSAFPSGYFTGTGALYGDSGFKRYAEEERRALEEHARRLGPGAG